MYHRVRRKMYWHFTFIAILIIEISSISTKSIDITDHILKTDQSSDDLDNNIIDFDSAYDSKVNRNYKIDSWNQGDRFNKESHRYIVEKESIEGTKDKIQDNNEGDIISTENDTFSTTESINIPTELLSTTENLIQSLIESTAEPDLTVIPLTTTQKVIKTEITTEHNPIQISEPSTTDVSETTENSETTTDTTNYDAAADIEYTTTSQKIETNSTETKQNIPDDNGKSTETNIKDINLDSTSSKNLNNITLIELTNTTTEEARFSRSEESTEESDVPIFTELDVEDKPEVPEDYYDSKDVLTTKAPNTDALSVIFGLAGSVVESVAERVMPKGIFELFKRMQRQNEALEAERLRSREENGGIGQFGRGILKSISTGLSRPFSQLMSTRRDNGSLDSDRGFMGSLASGVSSVVNVANSAVDAFKDRVQAIYPGTLWCGDGHSAQARSSDLGLFFFTDTCCRQHDACKLFILAGDTKYGLTNTGLFTRSHCSCDVKFRKCLMRTNSLVSSQIGLTYFNVLGPQCFRRAHPIVKCVRRTRITGQKCEEYDLDYTKPKMWQWFDNETF